eukprot:COSAG06_NODE_5140_length_3687_cov_1.862876_1_plen_44_part_00
MNGWCNSIQWADNTNKTVNTRMVKMQDEHEPPAINRPIINSIN